jgi:hypothetical protein
MSDDKVQPTGTDQSRQTELEQVGQQTEQGQESTTAQPARSGHGSAPGRRPLFGT